MKIVDRVCRVLEAMNAPYALIGGRAVAVRGHPRMTIDYDFLTTDRRVLQREIWSDLERDGVTVDARRGEWDDPLAGVVHLAFADGTEADIVVAKWKWEEGVIERAELLDVGGVELPVPRASDLILLKLSAGGILDLQDVVALLAVGDRDVLVREVDERIGDLSPEAQDAWKRIVAQT